MARCWYSYNGIGDPLLCTSYFLSFVTPPTCVNGPVVCAIYARGCGSTPTCPLSYRIRMYIANLQLALIAQPDTSPAIKKYVYGHN